MLRLFSKTMVMVMFSLLIVLMISHFVPREVMAEETIKIGVVDAYSGPFSSVAEAFYSNIKFAVDEQNKKGGVLGKKIELLREDSELKPDVATRKAKKLILEDKVDFIAGAAGSHILIALTKVATSYKKVMLIYSGGADLIMGKEFSEYVFRVSFNNHTMTSSLGQFMATRPYRKYYILCQDYVAGHEYAEGFKASLKKYLPEAKIVGEDYHPLSTKDFAPYISKIQTSGADVLFSANWGPDMTNLIRQARSFGLKPPFPLAMLLGDDASLLAEIREDGLGIHCTSGYNVAINTPENKAMLESYRIIHKDDKNPMTRWPTGSFGAAMCSMQMFLAGIQNAGSIEPQNFIPSFERFEYKTASGLYKMRKCDHQVLMPMFGGTVVSGKNPYYDFPWFGSDIVKFDAESVAIPATKDYNPRCP